LSKAAITIAFGASGFASPVGDGLPPPHARAGMVLIKIKPAVTRMITARPIRLLFIFDNLSIITISEYSVRKVPISIWMRWQRAVAAKATRSLRSKQESREIPLQEGRNLDGK